VQSKVGSTGDVRRRAILCSFGGIAHDSEQNFAGFCGRIIEYGGDARTDPGTATFRLGFGQPIGRALVGRCGDIPCRIRFDDDRPTGRATL